MGRVEQVFRLGNKVADLFLVQAGQLLGQPLQAGARDEVFGLGDIGRQCRAGAAFSKNVACGVDTQALQIGAGIVDTADEFDEQRRQVPDRGAFEGQILETEAAGVYLRLY